MLSGSARERSGRCQGVTISSPDLGDELLRAERLQQLLGRRDRAAYLEERWRRPPSVDDGDILGLAHWVVLEGVDRVDELVIEAYYDAGVPAAVVQALSSATWPHRDRCADPVLHLDP
jgi:hypothetical protein